MKNVSDVSDADSDTWFTLWQKSWLSEILNNIYST